MAPKRGARNNNRSNSPATKKAKTQSDEPTSPPPPPRSKRWSRVSGSANAEADYRSTWEEPEKWYSYVTICKPPSPVNKLFSEDEDDEEEEEEESDDESYYRGREERPRCPRKGCICCVSARETPNHPWLVSQAGLRKCHTQHIHLSLRNPDAFGILECNDFPAYGGLEVMQNLFVDFDEAAADIERGWREQWAVCEGMALWLLDPKGCMLAALIGDAEIVFATYRLVGRMFLAMLAQLDGLDLLRGDDTEVRSLGCVMTWYVKLAGIFREHLALDAERARGPKSRFNPDYFDDAIMSYAKQRGVTLGGDTGYVDDDIATAGADLEGQVKLPDMKKGAAAAAIADPWGWKAELRRYERRHGGVLGFVTDREHHAIGGDCIDMTTWTSAERKAKSYDGKDVLSKADIEGIKNGDLIAIW